MSAPRTAAKSYVAHYTPDRAGGWKVFVPKAAVRVHTKSLADADKRARQALAAATGLPIKQLAVKRRFKFGQDTEYAVILLNHARESGEGKLDKRIGDALFHLTIEGLTAADLATVCGIDIDDARRRRAATGLTYTAD